MFLVSEPDVSRAMIAVMSHSLSATIIWEELFLQITRLERALAINSPATEDFGPTGAEGRPNDPAFIQCQVDLDHNRLKLTSWQLFYTAAKLNLMPEKPGSWLLRADHGKRS